jgi:hypothetical protein
MALRLKSLRAVVMTAGLLLLVLGGTTSARGERPAVATDAGITVTACGNQMPRLLLRACRAYANKSVAALVGYYKYAKSGDVLAKSSAKFFEAEYRKPARLPIRMQLSQWPRAVRQVGPVNIVIDLVSVDTSDSYATITTHQSWQISDAGGGILYQMSHVKTKILMQHIQVKVKGAPAFRKWVVVNITH